ncbi:uncharacterized protein LOC119448947 [Dermacentor silvarum]|uniref:uncharacterized protein LOC119448947 n=1 Tax=Dermacentor silvarum TaxID=543639 RepID=UPI0021015133|nr:uncharacterized protein LOC119448947 [Dermacentor silvarum]
MKSREGKRSSSHKRHSKNPLLASHSKASASPKASKGPSAVQSSDAAPKAGVRAHGTKKPPRVASYSKASGSTKSSKGPSVVQSSDAASKADKREDGTGKPPLVAEPSALRLTSGADVEKGGATASDVKTDRADEAPINRVPSEQAWPKEPIDDRSIAIAEDADDSHFDSAESTLFETAHTENKAERKKQKPPSQESATKEKYKGGPKDKEITSPGPSSPAAEVHNEEKTHAAVNGEADAKAPKAIDKRSSISFNKVTAKSNEGKKPRKKRGPSRGNKAVQTNPEGQEAPPITPIHVLLSPSSCSLCDSNAPPSSYGAMQPLQIGKYGAVIAAPPVVTQVQKPSRGVKKTVRTTTTTTTTRRLQDTDRSRAPRFKQLIEETTTEEAQEAADDRNDAGGSKASTSGAGNVTSAGAVKKTVGTTRRPKDRHKQRKNTDTSDSVEGTITEVIGPAEKEGIQATLEKQPDGAKAAGAVVELSSKKNAASGALKKTVKTVRRLKDVDRDPRPQNDFIETVVREVVEVESEPAPEDPPTQAAAPVIAGVARDASATQYRYEESRRPASSPYRARHGVGAVYQRMQLRPPGFWANQPYRRPVAPYYRPCRHRAVQHIPGCRLAAFSRRAVSCWGPHNFCGGHHGPSCQRPPTAAPMVAHATSSSCPGLAGVRLQPHYHDHSQALVSANTGCGASPSVRNSARVPSLGNAIDVSEGTYDVFYDREPDLAAASPSGVRHDDRRRPTEFIWETPPRQEFVYYSCVNVAVAPTAPAANGQFGRPTDNDVNSDANGHNRDRVDARAARAATELSMAAGPQVTRMSPEETLFPLCP